MSHFALRHALDLRNETTSQRRCLIFLAAKRRQQQSLSLRSGAILRRNQTGPARETHWTGTSAIPPHPPPLTYRQNETIALSNCLIFRRKPPVSGSPPRLVTNDAF